MLKTARDIMTRDIITVDKNETVNHLIKTFLDHKISCVPVLDDKRELVGIVTKTDVLGYFLDLDLDISLKIALHDILDHKTEHLNTDIVSESEMEILAIMTPDPITADEDTPIDELAKIMIDHSIHRVVITNKSGISGILSTLDILYFVAGVEKNE